MSSMLQVDSLEFSERGFGPVSFQLERGETLLLCGLSGSGKSTLCQLLCRRREASGGKIDSVEGLSVGYIAHDFENQLLGTTVSEELELGVARLDDSTLVREALDQLKGELEGQWDDDPQDISKADQQILLLFCLVRSGAQLLVLDESLSYLDPAQWVRFLAAVTSLKQAGVTTILVSHQPECLQEVGRVLFLESGKVAYDGSPRGFDRALQERAGLFRVSRQPGNSGCPAGLERESDEVVLRLDGHCTDLRPSETFVVGGLAGSGKSWVMGALFGLWSDPRWVKEGALHSTALLRQNVGPSFWRGSLLEEWSTGLGCHGQLPEELKNSLWQAIPGEWVEKSPHHLSNGQLRYFGALSLMGQFPKLLFLEQPFQGLDGRLRRRLLTCLDAFLESGGRLVISTNSPSTATLLGDKVAWLTSGSVSFSGAVGDPEWEAYTGSLRESWR